MKCFILYMCNSVALLTLNDKRMPAYNKHTDNISKRSRVRVVAVPVALLPLSGIIILLGITFAILRLIIIS